MMGAVMTEQPITTKPPHHKSDRHQAGYVYEAFNAFHVRYYTTEIVDGQPKRVQRSKRLCTKDRNTGHGSKTAKAVKMLAADHMQAINAAAPPTKEDHPITEFWENRFLKYCEEVLATGPRKGQQRLKPSTLRGYKQVYRQHLKDHFGEGTLQEYQPEMGARLLDSLTAKQGYHVLKHIKAVGSAIFKRALKDDIITVNPWSAVEMPDDAHRTG